MAKKRIDPPAIEPRQFTSPEEIDRGIAKLDRRIKELNDLDIKAAVVNDTAADDVVTSNIREAIREVFGPNSPEFHEHQYLDVWAGPHYMNMDPARVIDAKERGRVQATGILKGLITRLQEKRADLVGGATAAPSTYLDKLNLHPRVLDVSRD